MALYKSEEILTAQMTQKEFGKLLDLSQQRISQLIEEKIVVRKEKRSAGKILVFDSLKNYYLSRSVSDEGVSYWAEKALHEQAKRKMAELKYQQRCGQLYEAKTVEQVLAEIFTDCRNKLLGLGHKLARQLERKSAAQICEEIDAEINECLTELSQNCADVDFTENITDTE